MRSRNGILMVTMWKPRTIYDFLMETKNHKMSLYGG